MSYFGKVKKPGAPSMFLRLGEIKYASSMSQGSNKADSMYSRHKNQDYVFLQIECIMLENIQIDPLPRIELFLKIGSRPQYHFDAISYVW